MFILHQKNAVSFLKERLIHFANWEGVRKFIKFAHLFHYTKKGPQLMQSFEYIHSHDFQTIIG